MVVEARPDYKVIGTRPIRHDGVDKVTGRAKYGADIKLAGMLHGRILRSPHAHARILRIDTSKAEALPGVKAVMTARDLPALADKIEELGESAANLRDLSNNILAADKALYRGHAVAAVAATSPHIAQEALRLIEVEYEVLPPVLDVRDAMRPEAPLLHPNMRTKELGQVDPNAAPSNVASHNQFQQGEMDAGWAASEVVIEREFTTSMAHQGYIEPHVSTAFWNADGQVTIWTSTQGAFPVRAQVSEILELPISRIKVVPMEIGGGFGGKIPVYLDPVAVTLSRKSGHPVKVLMDRTEVFEGSGPTSGTYIRLKLGATREGKLMAADAHLAYEAGAFPGSPVGAGMLCMMAPYDIPAIKIDGYDVVLNKPKTAAYRAPGAPAAAFAMEQVVDELAETLGLDPLQFRLMNASKEGSRQSTGQPFKRIGNVESVQAALASPHYNAPLEGPNRGRGVASGYWMNVGLKSSVTASVNPDGTVSLVEGSTDIGGTRASISMQLAETLGITAEEIKPTVVDTDSVGYTDVTGGSRTTYAGGIAAYEVGLDIIRQLRERAAKMWETTEDDVLYEDGVLRSVSDPSKTMTFKEIAGKLHATGAPVVGRATINAGTVGGAFSTQICDVEVDPETGKVTVLRYTVVQDVGTAIHPAYVEGQMQGGAVQGIGMALNEEYFYDESGRMANASYLDYRMPTSLDLPMIDAILVEVPNPTHPYGVRGVGEVPIVPPLAAVANAVYRATGHRFRNLPMSPRRIVEELHDLA
ncbi:MAG: xanthine dehydrogenase family protein molybdopterin-binding subunit [Dehalococcoidia bacterium]